MSTLRLARGDSLAREWPVLQDDGVTAQDLTGCTFRFTAKRRATDADADAVIAKDITDGIEITSAVGGLVVVTLQTADTDSLDVPVTLLWDLQLTDGVGAVWTLDSGTLVISADISRTTP